MKIPFIVDVDSKKETVYDIYSKLLKERIIFIEGEINDEKANLIVSELLYLDSISNDDINIYINSPGFMLHISQNIYVRNAY